jgi:hypothetical protein
MKSTLAEMMLVLKTLTTEPVPEEPPMVLIVPAETMPCACEAAYEDRRLYIRNDINWNDPKWISVVLHELEHHRQFVKRGQARDCEEWMARERDAVAVQTQYLETTNSGWRPMMTGTCR